MDDLPEIERSTDLEAGPDEVWDRIVDGTFSQEWLGVLLVARVGSPVDVVDRPMIGTVEAVDPGRSITWSWRPIDGDPSQVTIVLTPSEIGTRVTVTERLLPYRITGTDPFQMAA